MQNSVVYDDLHERLCATSRILSSISSFILQLTAEGELDWCNREAELEGVFGVPPATMRSTHFSQWLDHATADVQEGSLHGEGSERGGGAWSSGGALPSPSSRSGPVLVRHLTECLATGAKFKKQSLRVGPRKRHGGAADGGSGGGGGEAAEDQSAVAFFSYEVTPIMNSNGIDERGVETQVGGVARVRRGRECNPPHAIRRASTNEAPPS